MLDKPNFTSERQPSSNPLLGSFEINKSTNPAESLKGEEQQGPAEKLGLEQGSTNQDLAKNILIPEPQISSTPPIAQATSDDSVSAGISHEAADIDVIEKAWVDRAKHIVQKTSTDPRVQNDELAKVKADYIKKRFGKDIKITQEDLK